MFSRLSLVAALVALPALAAPALASPGAPTAPSVSARTSERLPPAVVEKELEIYREQAKQDPKTAGKPPQVVEKIVAGRLERFFGERCLLAQPWVKDDKQSVAQALQAASPKGASVSIRRFALFQVGA